MTEYRKQTNGGEAEQKYHEIFKLISCIGVVSSFFFACGALSSLQSGRNPNGESRPVSSSYYEGKIRGNTQTASDRGVFTCILIRFIMVPMNPFSCGHGEEREGNSR